MENNSIYTIEVIAGEEVECLTTKDATKLLSHVLIYNDIDRLEKAIYNTYTKEDAPKILSAINNLLTLGSDGLTHQQLEEIEKTCQTKKELDELEIEQ